MTPLENALLFTACVALALVVTYGLVPWAARLGALYVLHGLRDRLYGLGTPAFRETLLYEDVEFLLCSAIHAVRSKEEAWAVRIVASLLGAFQGGSAGKVESWRVEAYAATAELVDGEEVLGMLRFLTGAVACYIIFSRPVVLVIVLCSAPLIVGYAAGRVITEGAIGPLRQLARTVEGIGPSVSLAV